jgi:N-acetylneuraminic acid mutarotase
MKPWITAFVMLQITALAADLRWQPLADLPDPEGFAGSFVGVAGGSLILAGGTHFPDKMPWVGGIKVWYDDVYELKSLKSSWSKIGKLPKPNGYGLSLSMEDGLICLGGGDARANFSDVFRLQIQDGKVVTQSLPALPKPCAMMAGVNLGSVIYLCGGIVNPTDTAALTSFWSLDLQNLAAGWQTLPPCPGPARILASMGAANGAVYLFSGASLKPGPDGKAQREWLQDAWSYVPKKGWQRLADLPRVAVAAPGPAPFLNGRLWLLGGDDGALVNFEPKAKHPGFPRSVQAYDPSQNRWFVEASLPFSIVTTPAVMWQNGLIIAGGEIRPGKRTNAVWWGTPAKQR